jgi:hypothetical protein
LAFGFKLDILDLILDLGFVIIFFPPLQKLLKPFFKHCNPFLMAYSLAFAAAAFFNAATPPVFAIIAILRPTFAIFTIRLNLFK